MNKLKRMFKGKSGQGMVEYALILALVSIVSISSLVLLGEGISEKLDDSLNTIEGGNPGGSPVGISTDADYYDWGPLEELGSIPDTAYYAKDEDFDPIDEGYWRYNKASDPEADNYKPVVVIPKIIHGEVVESYKYMFYETYVTEVYAADSSAVTSMESMFQGANSTSLLIDHMDTSNVTNMRQMFAAIGSLENPITSFTFGNLDTSKVTNMENMFMRSNISKLDLRRMNTSSVVNMARMFAGHDSIGATPMRLNVTSFDTRNVERAMRMFYNSPVVELDVRNFRSDSIEEGENGLFAMFSGINIPMLDLSQFKLTSNLTGAGMFLNATIGTLDLSGMELAGTDVNDWSDSRWVGMLYRTEVENAYVKTDADAAIINMISTFEKEPDYSFVGLPNVSDYGGWGPLEELGQIPDDAYYATDADFTRVIYAFKDDPFYLYNKAVDPTSSKYEPVVVIPKIIQGEVVTSYKNMFAVGSYVTEVYAEDSSAVTTMENMFGGLQSTSLLIGHMDTSNVTSMERMFRNVGSPENPIESFTFGNLDTSNVTNMKEMFSGANISKLDLRRMDTSSVIDMTGMFESNNGIGVTPMELNVTSFDTRNVKWANSMFSNSPVVDLDVRNFRSDSIEDISLMFQGIYAPMLDLSQFRLTPNLIGELMFKDSTIEILDLSGMELAGTDANDWSDFGGMLSGANVANAYAKTDADAAMLNLLPVFEKEPYYYFVGLPN